MIASRRFACICLTVAIAGCGASSSPPATTLPDAYSGGQSVFAHVAALDYVPRGARWLVVANSVAELSARVPLLSVAAKRLGGPVAKELGKDVSVLRAAGVDTAAPAGVLYPEERSETIVVFAGIADTAKLVAFVKQHAGASSDEVSGKARLLTPKKHGRVAVVVRGKVVFVVIAAGASSRDRVAVSLANTSRAKSLATAPRFTRTAGSLTFGDHVGAYVSLSAMFADDNAALARLAARARQLKADLKKYAGKPLKRALLRRELRLLQASHAEYLRNRQRRRLLAGLGTMAVAGRIEKRAARVAVEVAPRPSSPFAQLLAPRAESLVLLRALRSFPLLAVAGHMRVKPLLALLEKLTGAQGVPFKQIKGTFDALTKGSFDRDFVPLLSGEIGFAVREGQGGHSGVDIVIGVRSRDKARALLKKIAADPRLSRFVEKGADGPRLRLPSAGQQVHVALAGNALVATTDATLLARIAAGGGSADRLASQPQLRALLARPAQHAAVLISGRLLGQLLAPQRHGPVHLRRWSERIPNIPRSKEYLRALTQMVALDKRIRGVEAQLEKLEQQYYRRIGGAFGDLVLLAAPADDRRMVAYGGLFVPGSLRQAIAAARVPAARDAAHKNKIKQRDALLADRDALWRKISQLRKQDITRFLNKK